MRDINLIVDGKPVPISDDYDLPRRKNIEEKEFTSESVRFTNAIYRYPTRAVVLNREPKGVVSTKIIYSREEEEMSTTKEVMLVMLKKAGEYMTSTDIINALGVSHKPNTVRTIASTLAEFLESKGLMHVQRDGKENFYKFKANIDSLIEAGKVGEYAEELLTGYRNYRRDVGKQYQQKDQCPLGQEVQLQGKQAAPAPTPLAPVQAEGINVPIYIDLFIRVHQG